MKIMSTRGVALGAITIFGLTMMPVLGGGTAEAKSNKSSRSHAKSRSHTRSTPPGWSKGKKTGWNNGRPPGQNRNQNYRSNRRTNSRYDYRSGTRYNNRDNTRYRSGTSGRTLVSSRYYSTRASADAAVRWARNQGYYVTSSYDSSRRQYLVRSYR